MPALIVLLGVFAVALAVWWDMRKVSLNPDEPYGFR